MIITLVMRKWIHREVEYLTHRHSYYKIAEQILNLKAKLQRTLVQKQYLINFNRARHYTMHFYTEVNKQDLCHHGVLHTASRAVEGITVF